MAAVYTTGIDVSATGPLTFPVAWSQSSVYTEFRAQIGTPTTIFALAVDAQRISGSGFVGLVYALCGVR
jgi:hypothetical protein